MTPDQTPPPSASAPSSGSPRQRPQVPPPPNQETQEGPLGLEGNLRPSWLALKAFGLAVLCSLLLPGILTAGLVPQELTAIRAEYALTQQTFMQLAGGIAVLAMVLGLSAAWAIPRWGSYRVCLIGYALFACGLAGIAWAPVGAVGALMGIVVSLGMAYLHQGNGLAAGLWPGREATMMNLLHGFNSLGKAIGPLVALLGSTWRHSFLALAGLALGVGLAGWLGLPGAGGRAIRNRAAPRNLGDAPSGGAGGSGPRGDPSGGVPREWLFWFSGLLFVPIYGMELLITLWLPEFLKREAGLGMEEGRLAAVALASVMLWTMCISRFLAPLLLLWVSPLALLALSTSCGLGLLLGTEWGWWQGLGGVVTMVLAGLGSSAAGPTFFAIASRSLPGRAGQLSIASGVAITGAWIGFGALSGWLGTRFGLVWALRCAPLLIPPILLGAWLVQRQGERPRGRPGILGPGQRAQIPAAWLKNSHRAR